MANCDGKLYWFDQLKIHEDQEELLYHLARLAGSELVIYSSSETSVR